MASIQINKSIKSILILGNNLNDLLHSSTAFHTLN